MRRSELSHVGYQLAEVKEAPLCFGSVGTYSLLQAKLSQELLSNKRESLLADKPQLIAIVNIGCQMHMASKADVPVKHWIELLDIE